MIVRAIVHIHPVEVWLMEMAARTQTNDPPGVPFIDKLSAAVVQGSPRSHLEPSSFIASRITARQHLSFLIR